MRLLRLEARNFRSFAELDLDLNASGVFSITGPNGAGKSTIFAAIEWALYGGGRGAGALSVARAGVEREECSVTLEFEVGGRTLRVTRIDGRDAWLTDVADDERLAQTLSGTSREVAVRLGLTREMFRGTFYAPQKEVEALSSKDPRKRKDQLERLLGIRHLRRAAELAAADAREQALVLEGLRRDSPDLGELRSELDRREKEAREAAPAVKRLKREIAAHEAQLKKTNKAIDKLAAQLTEHASRQAAAERAEGALALKKEGLESRDEQLRAALAAEAEQGEIEAALRSSEGLEARGRELDLLQQNHQRRQGLLAKERLALEGLAAATDALADLGPAPEGDPAADLSGAQEKLNELSRELREAGAARQGAEEDARLVLERMERAQRGAELARELKKLAGADERLRESRQELRETRDQRTEVKAEIAHQERHREAATESGVCPTCHRDLEGAGGDLIAGFDAAIAAARRRIKTLDRKLAQLEKAVASLEGEVQREVQLRTELEALGNPGAEAALAAEAARAKERLEKTSEAERGLEAAHAALEQEIPKLRAKAEESAELEAARRTAMGQKTKAEQQVGLLAEQLAEVGDDGYDPEAHAAVEAAVEKREEARRRLAVVRDQAASAALLAKQVKAERKALERALKEAQRLRLAADKVAPEPGAPEKLAAERDQLEAKLEEAREELEEANRRASAESEAVAAARGRLEDAGRTAARVDEEREELELRAALANALEDYREEASRRARPMVEAEASKLLREITEATYPQIRLTEDYFLEIAEGRDFYLSKRFSGGEQDLAALCLRLALARTLAHQRGTEHSFVILDEVFGSQDVGRRRTLMEQLTELSRGEFEQIFVISHTEDIVEQCSLHITVSREHGISTATGPWS
ncbi:MAG TPA: SMC family ATPase [Solirubrobacterales bacterium]|nr:SMC family ATPase [Solirubrobacterales bacterium]